MKRGQVSMEYMLVVGFMFLLLTPLLILYYTASQDTTDTLADSMTQRAGATIRDVAERVYFQGEPAQEIVTVTLPDEVRSSQIDGAAQVYTLRGAVTYDVRINGLAPLNGTLPSSGGRHSLIIRAQGGEVWVEQR